MGGERNVGPQQAGESQAEMARNHAESAIDFLASYRGPSNFAEFSTFRKALKVMQGTAEANEVTAPGSSQPPQSVDKALQALVEGARANGGEIGYTNPADGVFHLHSSFQDNLVNACNLAAAPRVGQNETHAQRRESVERLLGRVNDQLLESGQTPYVFQLNDQGQIVTRMRDHQGRPGPYLNVSPSVPGLQQWANRTIEDRV
jgi:hypothetical protein